MKIIKILISMTLVNAVVVLTMAVFATKNEAIKEARSNTQKATSTGQLDTTTVMQKSPDPTAVATATAKPVTTKKPSATKTPAASQTPTATATPLPTVTPTPTPTASGCIVTINGSSYNIQNLLKTHSGGSSMLKCGTDLTSVFQSRHKTNYSMMSKYKI